MLAQNMLGMLLMSLLAVAGADTRLSEAAMSGEMATVQALIQEGIDVNSAQGDGNTALHWAAFRRDLQMAKLLLEAGASTDVKTRLGEMSPLFMAARNGDAAMLNLLLEHGAEVNAVSSNGTIPLMMAAASGEVDAVRALLDKGADVDAVEATNEQTAVMFAAALNRADVIGLLAEHGAELDVRSRVSAIPQPGGNRGGPKVSAMGGNTALHYAAREGHFDAVRTLVEAGADVNIVSGSDDLSVVNQAIIIGHFGIAQYLLENGADPTLATKGGLTPLYATIDAKFAQREWYPPPLANVEQQQVSHLDLMSLIIENGAEVDAKLGSKPWFRTFGNSMGPDPVGSTAFWRATQANDIEAMRLLLDAGADPQVQTEKGCSALCVAAGLRHSTQGANMVPEARMEVVRFLVEELNLAVNTKDEDGHTPLHGAAFVGRNDIIEYLVAHGADIKARANTVSGSGDGGGQAYPVDPGTGDSVADMANGWSMNSVQYPETIALAVKLGAEFSNTCWASTCVNPTRPDKTPQQDD